MGPPVSDRDRSRPLDDEQLLAFLTDGYVVVRPETLDPEHHDRIHHRATELHDLAENAPGPTHLDILGDNLRALIPELDGLLDDPVIDGALSTVLGHDYLIHPHSYCHRSGERDQLFHQDGNLPWNERGHQRSHRPDWALVFYYPQAVTVDNGPTEVVAGTQYYTVDHETDDGDWHRGDRIDRSISPQQVEAVFGGPDLERRDRTQTEALARGLGVSGLERRFLEVPAGSVVIAHYDLIHRGSRVTEDPVPRYMFKFNAARLHEPTGGPPHDPIPPRSAERVAGRLRPVVEAQWRWLAADGPPSPSPLNAEEVETLASDLDNGSEDAKVQAAYRLGCSDNDAALLALASALEATTESTRRAASHGLRQAGPAGVAPLLQALGSPRPPVRRPAAAGLGTVAACDDQQAIMALISVMEHDPDDLVRSNAAYALGQALRRPTRRAMTTVEPVVEALLGRLAPGAEPDNAFNSGFARSTVRQSAAFALTALMANHRLGDRHLDRIIDGPLRDGDRYVQGLTVEGLARVRSLPDAARRRLIRYLAGRRLNPSP